MATMTGERAREVFQDMDKNGNGFLTKSEIRKYFKKNRELKAELLGPDFLWNEFFTAMDTDGDKQFDVEEFVTYFQALIDKQEAEAAAAAAAAAATAPAAAVATAADEVVSANEERTYIMIKPDGVQRGLIGNIIGRFEVCFIWNACAFSLVSSLGKSRLTLCLNP